jgi:hypothetical protein
MHELEVMGRGPPSLSTAGITYLAFAVVFSSGLEGFSD